MVNDKVSKMLGAPPNSWKGKEIDQMKHIRLCFRNAFTKDEKEEVAQQVDLADISERDAFGLLFGSGGGNFGGSDNNNNQQQNPGQQNSAFYSPDDMGGAGSGNGKKQKNNADGNGGNENEGKDDGFNGGEEERDVEWYLPKNSPLRSKGGDSKAPLNVPFKDHETFLHSCEYDEWREIFDQPAQDNFLAEIAKSLVSHICSSQSRKELRVRHGSVPAGKLLRKKREHITPLTLVLHEIKLWAAHKLRTASIFDEDTFRDIRRRYRYIDSLSQKEVWGNAAGMLQQGMRPIAHDKLFRLFLTTKEDLRRAEDYAYRGYCRRSSREKLKKLSDLMKEVILREIRLVSYLFTVKKKLSDPKTQRLQPLTLMNKLQNQGFVDFKNFVNVCMYELFQMPLVRAALTSDYDNPKLNKNVLEDLSTWTESNLFCAPNPDGGNPIFQMDDNGVFPKVYAATAEKLKAGLKEADPHAKTPLSVPKHMKILKKAFADKDTVNELIKLFLKLAAAVQDLIPSLFAIYKLWAIAGDGGDFTVYDTLRGQVIGVMSNTISRVYAVQTTSRLLIKKFADLAKQSEQLMEKRRLRTRKAEYKAPWIVNFYFLRTEILPQEGKGFQEAYKQLWEVAKDAWEYSLTAEQLDEKVTAVKDMVEAIIGKSEEKSFEGSIQTNEVIRIGKDNNDWLNSRGQKFGGDNGNNSVKDQSSNNSTESEEDDSEDSDSSYDDSDNDSD